MSAPVTRFRTLAVVAGLAALQAACAQPQVAATGPRIYAVDVQGRSALCDVPQKVSLAAGRQTEAALTMDNDGGWCGISTDRAGPGLVAAKPAHGRLNVRKVGATTRVDYIPDRGFVGSGAAAGVAAAAVCWVALPCTLAVTFSSAWSGRSFTAKVSVPTKPRSGM
ncbi:MAG: hypothetical protein ICV73_02955 [Acetobacteraceae bacterium]|nr:hypothetical protein [Acetobacteraceae bacterium]